jgi:hypothetical protein
MEPRTTIIFLCFDPRIGSFIAFEKYGRKISPHGKNGNKLLEKCY